MMNVANVINSRKKALEEQKRRQDAKENLQQAELEKEFYNIAREMKEDNE